MNKQDIVQQFARSKWMSKANSIISNPAKLFQIAILIRKMAGKGGLRSIRSTLALFTSYIRDIATNRYKGYDTKALILIVAALLYVLSPLDIVPDFLPAGFLDDITIVTWALSKLKKELNAYAQNREEE